MKICLCDVAVVLTVITSGLAGCGDSSTGTGGAGGTTASTTSASSSTKAATTGSTSTTTGTGTTAATGSTSTGGQSCSMLATKADCRNCCGTQNPAGNVKLVHAVANSCGCQSNVTCSAQCAGEAFCTDGTSALGTACNTCIGGLQGNEACAQAGLATCQQDVECAAAENCQLGCLALP